MRPKLLARRLHKWLALLVGLQLFIWAASGVYMVSVHIDFIRGDTLVQKPDERLDGVFESVLPAADLLLEYPETSTLTLHMRGERPVYRLDSANGRTMVDAISGHSVPALTGLEAGELAKSYYLGDAIVESAAMVSFDPPSEIKHLTLPVWQINFADTWNTSFYIAADTGELLSRRHSFWRAFDFLWMLHIMDYDTRENINNSLLRIASGLALLFGLSGVWLLLLRFLPRRRSQ